MTIDGKDIIIKVEDVTKKYQLGSLDGKSFKEEMHAHKKKGEPAGKELWALKGVSFSVERGESLGIIGGNGAGKSTLLKILSRITAPTSGRVCLDGKLSSMLEVGTGFHPELTGRENIYINGMILGMTRKEIDAKLEEIIEFSECRDFIDTPVKRYSSGMYVKLAFSVAAFLESDIMILDEVLSVGDMKFQNKCLNKIQELSTREGKTVLCVSHNMTTISKFCNRCLVLEKGNLIFDGDTQEAIRAYFGDKRESEVFVDYTKMRRYLWLQRDEVRFCSAEYVDKKEAVFWEDEKLRIHFTWQNNADVVKLGLRVEIVYAAESGIGAAFLYDFYQGNAGETGDVTVDVDISALREGTYKTMYTLFVRDLMNESVDLDCVEGLSFEKRVVSERKIVWHAKQWGCIELPELQVVADE